MTSCSTFADLAQWRHGEQLAWIVHQGRERPQPLVALVGAAVAAHLRLDDGGERPVEREAPFEDSVAREPAATRRRSRSVTCVGAIAPRAGGSAMAACHDVFAAVRRAVETDAPVRPRLCRRPLHRVVAVVELVAEHVERAALGGAPARARPARRRRRPGRPRAPRRIAADGRGAVLPVGRALHDHRERTTLRGAVDVGPQHGAVAHGDGDVALDEHVHGATGRSRTDVARSRRGSRDARRRGHP